MLYHCKGHTCSREDTALTQGISSRLTKGNKLWRSKRKTTLVVKLIPRVLVLYLKATSVLRGNENEAGLDAKSPRLSPAAALVRRRASARQTNATGNCCSLPPASEKASKRFSMLACTRTAQAFCSNSTPEAWGWLRDEISPATELGFLLRVASPSSSPLDGACGLS